MNFLTKKKNQVSILQWVWNTQFCPFSLLLNTTFSCTALLLPRLASDWKTKGLPLPRPYNPWQQILPIFQLSTGFLLWNEVGCPELSWGNSHQVEIWHGFMLAQAYRVLQESPAGWSCPQLPTVPLLEPQTRLWRVWLWKNAMQEGVNKNICFWSCAQIFFSAVQAFPWKLETKRSLMYEATWQQRQQKSWDRKRNCFLHVPIMGHWQGRFPAMIYLLCSPLCASCGPWAVSWEPTCIPKHGILWIQPLFSLCCFCTAEGWPWQIAWLLGVTPNLVHCHGKHHSGFKTWKI